MNENLPNGWGKVLLSTVCQLSNGFAFNSNDYISTGIPLIRISDIKNGNVILKKTVKVKENKEYDKYSVAKGDILIAMSGATTGKFGIYAESEKAYQNQRVGKFVIKSNDVLDNKFLLYQLDRLKRQIEKEAYGGAQPNISSKKIEEMSLVLPSLPEQERIVAKIEELFSELDKGVENLQTIKQQLKVYRQAVLKDAFEGKLTEQWRKDNNIPFELNWKGITFLAKTQKHAIKAGPFGSALKKEMYSKTGYKIYGQEQVISGDENIGDYFINEEKYQELISCKIAPNDVLISLVGTVGKVLLLSTNCSPGIINPRLIKISIDEEIMLAKFFKYYFESSYVKSLYKVKTHGATMDVLNLGMIKELPFPIFSKDEQIEIIGQIETRLSVCDKIEQTVDETLQKAEALRQSILKKAFEGKLVN